MLFFASASVNFAYASSDSDFNPTNFIQEQSAIIAGEQLAFDHMANGPLNSLQACIKSHFCTNDCDSSGSGGGGGFGAENNDDNTQQTLQPPSNAQPTSPPTSTLSANNTTATIPASKQQPAPTLPISNEKSTSTTWNYHF